MGEISAARTTTPGGELVAPEVAGADLRSDLTTSLTPRLRDLFLAAVGGKGNGGVSAMVEIGGNAWSCAERRRGAGKRGGAAHTFLHALQHFLAHLLIC